MSPQLSTLIYSWSIKFILVIQSFDELRLLISILSCERNMIDQDLIRIYNDQVTPSITCISVLACLAHLIDQKLPQCTVICQRLAEVTRSLLSDIFLRCSHRGFVWRRLLPRLNSCLTLFSGKTSPLITGCCTPLIGRWKRGFGFQGWWPPIHVEPSLLASVEMHYNNHVSVQKLSL